MIVPLSTLLPYEKILVFEDLYLEYQSSKELILLSDAALALAIGCEIKWFYNSARRLAKPIRRSMDEAIWWRLVHHLAVRLGAPLAEAAQAADTLLAPGMHPGRVRLRTTLDESVSVVVDLDRFYDGAALALAAAQFLAVPRLRGRPRVGPAGEPPAQFTPDEMATALRLRSLTPSARLEAALEAVANGASHDSGANAVVRLLSEASIPYVVIGDVAAAFHGAPWASHSLDLCADLSSRHRTSLASVLGSLKIQPRSAAIREGFRIDAGLLRAAPMLALRAGAIDLNIYPEVDDVGEYQQVATKSLRVDLGASAVLILGLDTLIQSGARRAIGLDRERSRRQELLRVVQGMDSRTR